VRWRVNDALSPGNIIWIVPYFDPGVVALFSDGFGIMVAGDELSIVAMEVYDAATFECLFEPPTQYGEREGGEILASGGRYVSGYISMRTNVILSRMAHRCTAGGMNANLNRKEGGDEGGGVDRKIQFPSLVFFDASTSKFINVRPESVWIDFDIFESVRGEVVHVRYCM
jgi:hypothetical protein